jgi:acetyl/propionyl-CoA carboxylase alpha subunit/acetyl-CoA carboxylase carboxyltransferase component
MITRLLIANRGEVAVRIIRTAAEMGITTVAIFAQDDAECLHVSLADEAIALPGTGASAYLASDHIIAIAKERRCDAIHPGWGFLSENAAFAARCQQEGITFVGPSAATLSALGDKTRARALATAQGVPVLRGSVGPVTLEEAQAFLSALGPGAAIMLKAVAGGGGRGMRVVTNPATLASAYRRCQSEAERAFGDGAVYVEEYLPGARHIEVQIVGDGTGAVSHLWERDCSIQRRHQKVVEIAPCPDLSPEMRALLTGAALRMAAALRYVGLGTFEFLVPANAIASSAGHFAFIEANPRLQVEHTITEEIFGLDLVRVQLLLASGMSLAEIGLDRARVPTPRGMAMQLRVNAEEVRPDGQVQPSIGTLAVFQPPTGPGVRVDTLAYQGYAISAAFDSLLAKIIVHAPTPRFSDLAGRARRALRELHVRGVATNVPFLKNLLEHPDFVPSRLSTTFVDDHIAELARPREDAIADDRVPLPRPNGAVGARIDTRDPLAVLVYGKARQRAAAATPPFDAEREAGAIRAPMTATVVSIEVQDGAEVVQGQEIIVLNAMKMEHVLRAPVSGVVRQIVTAPGETVAAHQVLMLIEPAEGAHVLESQRQQIDLDRIRPDLAEVLERRRRTRDEARPHAVEERHRTGHRTVRENIADLCDPGTFLEYGPLVLAAQRQRRSLEELIEKTPADGMVMGIGAINGHLFPEPRNRCVVMAYDYTVLAGTQGARNHVKTDRMIDVAERGRMPVVLFAEGGGGRAGDTDNIGASAGSTRTFHHFARLSGLVPLVGITTGRCFAGNAALLGCCDVIIATAGSNIGMGGPAMIEGGGLGIYAPEEIGPMDVQVPNGVVDIAVADEAEAVRVAKQYLSYFQGSVTHWEAADQRLLRHIVPENRLRVYDVRDVIRTLADVGSVLELRQHFGLGMITALARIEGRPLGIVANNPMHLGGAITADGADKAARFMQLCDAFDIPLLFLCDTPGIMVGPEIEKTALVRHSSRMFVIGANLSVPCMTIVLRKAYGLGAIAMAAGSFKTPLFTVSWPTGEFGGMNLEGQVKLGYRNELAAIADPGERRRVFDEMVARAYERGKALNEAVIFGVDDTIDPAESRDWIASMLKAVRPAPPSSGKKRPVVDAW